MGECENEERARRSMRGSQLAGNEIADEKKPPAPPPDSLLHRLTSGKSRATTAQTTICIKSRPSAEALTPGSVVLIRGLSHRSRSVAHSNSTTSRPLDISQLGYAGSHSRSSSLSRLRFCTASRTVATVPSSSTSLYDNTRCCRLLDLVRREFPVRVS